MAAQAELQRTQDLVAQGFLSEARLDEVRRAVDVAQAQLDGARAQRAANAEQGTDVAQAQAQLALAALPARPRRPGWPQAVLTAPADARVLSRRSSPGRSCSPGARCSAWRWPGRRSSMAQVDERYLDQLQVGQTASVVADAFPASASRRACCPSRRWSMRSAARSR